MEVISTPLSGVLLVKPSIFGDERGYFFESYHQERYRAAGIDVDFVQDNQSFSQKGVVRGLHFQRPPYAQAKLVSVIRGAVLDVAVDLRRGSVTYGQHVAVELTGDNHWQLFIPAGFAHGFSVLEANTLFAYKCSGLYNKASEGSILFNDPDLAIDWRVSQPIVSEKDMLGIPFAEFNTPF